MECERANRNCNHVGDRCDVVLDCAMMAYHKPHSAAVQITKIAAVTVVLCSVVLGCFLLASAYVTANASCRQLEQELELLSEAADRFQSPPQPEALVQLIF
nr:unnamed protein product [Callosobruchus analis]